MTPPQVTAPIHPPDQATQSNRSIETRTPSPPQLRTVTSLPLTWPTPVTLLAAEQDTAHATGPSWGRARAGSGDEIAGYGTMAAVSFAAAQADTFYTEILAEQTVWAVCDVEGFPAPLNGDGQRSMPFWSKRSRAQKVIDTVAAYTAFEPTPIPLSEWRDRWLPGLAADGLLVGLNWSGAAATGYDLTPGDAQTALHAREIPT